MSKVHSFHGYKFKLLSEEDLLANSIMVYELKNLSSKDFTLDSQIFGATLMLPICSTCGQNVNQCTGHYALIKLPFPIIIAICLRDFKNVIENICPICSHFLADLTDINKIPLDERVNHIRKEVEKNVKDNFVECPNCGKKVVQVKIIQDNPMRICLNVPQKSVLDQVNPVDLFTMLSNFSQLDEIGFKSSYHPKNFMSYYIPIVMNKLRPKLAGLTESTITGYYRKIVENIGPELERIIKILPYDEPIIPKGDVLNQFNKLYDQLVGYYRLITNMGSDKTVNASLNAIERRDRKYFDPHNALMGRFKGKYRSFWAQGIISTRHNVSLRTVLNGAVDGEIHKANIPKHLANKLGMFYHVYAENLFAMKQLVAAMSKPEIWSNINIPKVLRIKDGVNNNVTKVTIQNAISKASLLKPSDQIAITLCNNVFVEQCRYPSMREESWSSFCVQKDDNSVVTIPLPVCKMKMADFDGDEHQIYAFSTHDTDAECILLHSTISQFLQYTNGNLAVWYSAQAPAGIKKIKRDLIISGGRFGSTLDYSKGSINVSSLVETYLPKDLSYIDNNTEIINGKFISEKTSLVNQELHKYMLSLYGGNTVRKLMDNLIKLSYDINHYIGDSIGYEFYIYGHNQEIKRIKEEGYEKMKELEISSNSDIKDIEIINVSESQKAKIKAFITEDLKDSNIDKLGYTLSEQSSLYSMTVLCDHATEPEGGRIAPILAEGSRVNCAYPRFSVDPCAYGYINKAFIEDISPVNHFNGCKIARRQLFQKGKGTANQGYVMKQVVATFGNIYADFNSAVVTDYHLISLCYGNCGFDPRNYVKQPLLLSIEPHDARTKKLRDKILDMRNIYSQFTLFTRNDNIPDIFISGFNFNQYIDRNSTEGVTNNVDVFIERLMKILRPDNADKRILYNFIQHEHFFRIKLNQRKCSNETLDKMIDLWKWCLVSGGDAIGMKASLGTTAPLTQASLHATHGGHGGASYENIQRSYGLDRFEELLSGNNHKNVVVTIKLKNDDKESCLDFANSEETFFFNSIVNRISLCDSLNIPQFILDLHPNVDLKSIDVANYFVVTVLDLTIIANYGIHVVDIIERFMSNFSDIMFITGKVINSTEFMAYIFFKPYVKVLDIYKYMEEWIIEKNSTIVHGKYLVNCYVSENKMNPNHYIVEANEIDGTMALENLIFDPRVDPYGCRSSNNEVERKLLGVFESNARHIEDLIYTAMNLSDTNDILHRHYKLISDAILFYGYPVYASRNSLKFDNDIDTIRMISFEVAEEFIRQSLKYSETQKIGDPICASVFGELPSLGTGVSKVTLFKS
jgi:DNA-directed RNA polymerase beta' subunit